MATGLVKGAPKEAIMGAAAERWEERALCGGAAFVWLTTGLAILHPYYREVGHHYLARLGLPDPTGRRYYHPRTAGGVTVPPAGTGAG
jgi:hypothetical protein